MGALAACLAALLSALRSGAALSLRNGTGAALARGVDVARLDIGEQLAVSHSTVPCLTRYCMPAGYQDRLSNEAFDNTSANNGQPNTDGWQKQVYQYARAVANQFGVRTVADVGCGTGFKLMQEFRGLSTVGYEVEPTLSWLRGKYPSKTWKKSDFSGTVVPADLVISSDVVEHIPDPDGFMSYLHKFDARYYVVSTPDRAMGLATMGPPRNPSHVREWTHDEFAHYASTHGFNVLDARAYRTQSTMWFLLARTGASRTGPLDRSGRPGSGASGTGPLDRSGASWTGWVLPGAFALGSSLLSL